MKKNEGKVTDPYESINKRLDALIRVILEMLYDKKDKKFTEGDAIRILNSAGLTPTEIAKILGRKSRQSVSGELYGAKKNQVKN